MKRALLAALLVSAVAAGLAGTEGSARAADLQYLGGQVLHSSRKHLVFWEPSGSGLSFEPGYVSLVERFLAGVAADSRSTSNEFGIMGLYRDAGGPAAYDVRYGGAIIDTAPLPPSECAEPVLGGPPGWLRCVTDAQIQAELERVASNDRIPAGPQDVFFLLTPNGLGSCQDVTSQSCALGGRQTGYCAYHSGTSSGLLYAVIPYNAVPGHCQSGNPRPNASAADPALSSLAHELAEVVTDPLGDAWTDGQGSEIGDLCISSFGPALGGSGAGRWNEVIAGRHYWLQELYSRLAGGCAARPAPDAVVVGGRVRHDAAALTARASVPGGRPVAYRWWFGDGRTAGGRTVRHRYGRHGRYRVTVRVTDSAGNWAYGSRLLVIRRPPAPARRRPRRGRLRHTTGGRSAGSGRTTSR